jgi:G:T/U-mismatch repair DNA glycosylase
MSDLTPQSTQGPLAWDGTAAEFWRAVEAVRRNEDIESDAAVLGDVLGEALRLRAVCAAQQEAVKNLIEEKNEAIRKVHDAQMAELEARGPLLAWQLFDSVTLRPFMSNVRSHCIFHGASDSMTAEDLLEMAERVQARLEQLR